MKNPRQCRHFRRASTLATAVFLACAVLSTQPALAQDKPAAPVEKDTTTPKPPQTVEKVEVTASQSAYDVRQDDTATKIVVNAEEIKKYGDTQVLDVLKRLPGVTVLGNSIRLRGLGNGYTQILIDGDRKALQ